MSKNSKQENFPAVTKIVRKMAANEIDPSLRPLAEKIIQAASKRQEKEMQELLTAGTEQQPKTLTPEEFDKIINDHKHRLRTREKQSWEIDLTMGAMTYEKNKTD